MDQAAAAAGLKTTEWRGWLLAALTFAPEPISAERLRLRTPYAATQAFEERLANAARQGWLTPIRGDEYRLTEAGWYAAQRIVEAAYAAMASLQPLPPADLTRLAAHLRRLVEASLAAPQPPGKWCIAHSRRIARGDEASPAERIDQYLSDLGAYRDDAHLAAWQPYGLSGQAWEALTCLWRGEANSLDELCLKLQRRGHSRETYAEALQDLVKRGLVAEKAGTYRLTEQGKMLRQEAEEATDRYFYAPWAGLSEGEMHELRDLLTRLAEGLRRPEP